MIERTTFLGIPLRTPRQRRIFVVGYYFILLGFASLALWKPHGMTVVLVPQTITLAGLLGGIRMGGPVKPYSASAAPLHGSMLSLNLTGRRAFGAFSPLDERERLQRDHAHYTAYRILVVTLSVALLLCLIEFEFHATWLIQRSVVLFWALLVFAFSLPQSVLLWTEPSEPVAELIEMR